MKQRTIVIYRKDIEYDLAAETDRLYKARPGDNNVRNQLRYESTSGNLALLARYLRRHSTKITFVLKPYLREDGYTVSEIVNDPVNITSTEGAASYRDMSNDLTFECFFPDTWDDKQFGLLCEGIYQYILNNCIIDFLKIAPNERVVYIEEAQQGYRSIAKAITARIQLQHRGRIPYDTE